MSDNQSGIPVLSDNGRLPTNVCHPHKWNVHPASTTKSARSSSSPSCSNFLRIDILIPYQKFEECLENLTANQLKTQSILVDKGCTDNLRLVLINKFSENFILETRMLYLSATKMPLFFKAKQLFLAFLQSSVLSLFKAFETKNPQKLKKILIGR